jgi:hypothetical protein
MLTWQSGPLLDQEDSTTTVTFVLDLVIEQLLKRLLGRPVAVWWKRTNNILAERRYVRFMANGMKPVRRSLVARWSDRCSAAWLARRWRWSAERRERLRLLPPDRHGGGRRLPF